MSSPDVYEYEGTSLPPLDSAQELFAAMSRRATSSAIRIGFINPAETESMSERDGDLSLDNQED